MDEIIKYSHCFVCGDSNEVGLKARFFQDDRQVFTEVKASDDFEGYRGIYHGGILSTVLDEVMLKAILAIGVYAVTAEMTVRFLKPVRTGDKIKFTGRVVTSKGRIYLTEGQAFGEDGQPVATAKGKYFEPGGEFGVQLMESIDVR